MIKSSGVDHHLVIYFFSDKNYWWNVILWLIVFVTAIIDGGASAADIEDELDKLEGIAGGSFSVTKTPNGGGFVLQLTFNSGMGRSDWDALQTRGVYDIWKKLILSLYMHIHIFDIDSDHVSENTRVSASSCMQTVWAKSYSATLTSPSVHSS